MCILRFYILSMVTGAESRYLRSHRHPLWDPQRFKQHTQNSGEISEKNARTIYTHTYILYTHKPTHDIISISIEQVSSIYLLYHCQKVCYIPNLKTWREKKNATCVYIKRQWSKAMKKYKSVGWGAKKRKRCGTICVLILTGTKIPDQI